MSINLTSYQSLRTALFVRIDVAQYRTTSSASFTSEILTFSDHSGTFAINGQDYVPLGDLLAVSSTSSELRASGNEITISISGIPNASIAEIVHSKIKGSPVKLYRAYFTEAGVQIGTTQGRWIGSVNNYTLDEEYDPLGKSATNTIQIDCLSNVELLQNKVAGRKTNPSSMKVLNYSDTSFDRAPNLLGSSFDFGGKR